ncbi:N-acetylmuramoyl-L-alanine amidase [Paenibacillus larvae subsp. larvae]|uniref:N-acetylmuramoyl-L-alanine amidase n=3 Tax=Paenibacillus larvae TaxID=1464 RepID=A0A6C0QU45_9BACL|nr:N-acetylmuramoyl-L-alanine amidase [Paenibacillus larvae]QHZ54135.1 N-acetylmuramoyl-L-alanine amidase [Paenibacillus phage phiERICV]AQZ48569.1 N-acetylmuramoyl-L-alanine amidase [Paenibacillus larvae subsp. pulvifaciens]AVF31379.1 N-acetylmuramoyl-L-alanine amidase [Paenibacillus larvae subsp. larvae]MCY7521675.1 N-acetylmuramoyl-L-alanine amidase [Paenibacillus larvae]MCY9681618.1 N-acetylmuramoyl-L-alanine amidase [Paenibacillus larvae]
MTKQITGNQKENSIQQHEEMPIKDWLLPLKNSEERTKDITHVMIHFISNAVQKPKDPYQENDIYNIFNDYGLSSHYMINRNGDIYRLVNENRAGYHAGKGSLPGFPEYTDKMNEYSIGIELFAIGTWEEMSIMMSKENYDLIDSSDIGYTDAQYRSLNLLLDDIYKRNPSVLKDRNHVIGHDEYAPGRKTDPGSLFDWSRIGFKKGEENMNRTLQLTDWQWKQLYTNTKKAKDAGKFTDEIWLKKIENQTLTIDELTFLNNHIINN